MKKLILAVLLIPSIAIGAPFLTCDPQEGVTNYRIDGTTIIDAEANGAVLWSIDSIPVGTHNGTLEAGKPYVLDGVPQGTMLWSTPVPFVLGVPSVESSTNIGLIP